MPALLTIRGLSKSFGGLAAVQGVSMELRQGVITALVGPNGAGKTTLFNLVTGNIVPDAGAITPRGPCHHRLAPHRVARLGIARSFQDLRLFTHMSVRDNVLASVERTAWLWQRVGGAARRHAAEGGHSTAPACCHWQPRAPRISPMPRRNPLDGPHPCHRCAHLAAG